MTYPPNFRFYHYESEKMYPVLNICFQGTPTVTVAYNPVKKYRLDSGVLMQMTFLLDNKGHVLYEDDIICTTDNIIGVVKFGDYGCNEWEGWHHGLYIDWTCKKYGLRKDIGFWTKNREIERIGNIHENPELLI